MSEAHTIDHANYINIALMLVSGVAAILLPFHLFLFSYAVLGPLHYLTEISWLHDRRYFMVGQRDYIPLVVVAGLVTLFALLPYHSAYSDVSDFLIFMGFAVAGALVFAKTLLNRTGIIVLAALACFLLLRGHLIVLLLLTLLLPTLIHVFAFTGAFILSGVIKTRQLSGYISMAVFVVIGILLLAWRPHYEGWQPAAAYVRAVFGQSSNGTINGFAGLNLFLLSAFDAGPQICLPGNTLDLPEMVTHFLFESPVARALMAFVAFSYTYHYLNWFSKTSVIGWHLISRQRLMLIIGIWFASLALYASSYQTGVKWLFFLSFLHVVLEFPLDHITIAGIMRQVLRPKHPYR